MNQAPAALCIRAPQSHRASWVAVALAVGSVASFGVFFVLPYLANGLDQFAPEQVASGSHDPKDLWPFNQGLVGGMFWLGAYLTMMFSPLFAAITAGWAAFDLLRSRGTDDRRRTTLGILTIVFSVVTWVWLLSPLGTALIGWMLD